MISFDLREFRWNKGERAHDRQMARIKVKLKKTVIERDKEREAKTDMYVGFEHDTTMKSKKQI